jgi:pyruvyl transferase EpsO
MDARTAVLALRARLEATLAPSLAGVRRCALVDFPNYSNVGDSAIYLGELACLRALGVPRPRFICDFRSYDRELLARRIGPGGIILLAGGGSLGDLWPIAQRMREVIVRDFPHHAIIQLPQSIHFERSGELRRARRVFDAHPDFTLFARDDHSLQIARTEFRAPSALCPDMAFALGPLTRAGAPASPVLHLLRTDKESRLAASDLAGLRTVDWLDEPASMLRTASYHLIDLVGRPRLRAIARPLLTAVYAPLARQRLHRGVRLLSSASVVVTDRLHGHVLSLLLGLPHVILDNSYGKLSSFHETWTSDVENVVRVHSVAEAREVAATLSRAHAASAVQA